jgi:glutaredoxin-like protein
LAVLKASEREYVTKVFGLVKNDVKILFFYDEHESQSSKQTREILEEIAAISDKIDLTSYDLIKDIKIADSYGIDKTPATVIVATRDTGVRYYGVPSGYLVSSLIEDVVQISKDDSELLDVSKQKLAEIRQPLKLQVFVSSTSPYSPSLVNISHRMALENNEITADVIEVKEFPHLAMRYNITEVPFTIVNDTVPITGAPDENDFIDKVLDAYRGK